MTKKGITVHYYCRNPDCGRDWIGEYFGEPSPRKWYSCKFCGGTFITFAPMDEQGGVSTAAPPKAEAKTGTPTSKGETTARSDKTRVERRERKRDKTR